MGKTKITTKKFPNEFKYNQIKSKLNSLDPMAAYSFSRRHNPNELDNILTLLPSGYVQKQSSNIHSIDFIYSGSTAQPFILGFMVGRLDSYQGQQTYDIDFFHIAPENGSVEDYFMNQFFHFMDDSGNRISTVLNPSVISNSLDRENHLYNTYLTDSTTGYTFQQFESVKPKYIDLFKKSF